MAKQRPEKDLVILHGMFSSGLGMFALRDAIVEQAHYRKVHLIDLPLKHRIVPQVGTRDTATELWRNQLQPKIKSGSLTRSFDVVGHSNGGYVAIALHQVVPFNTIDWTFTLATPAGFHDVISSYELARRVKNQVIHFRGGVDCIPFGGQHNPGSGDFVVTFPDEGHCSIHSDAAQNGLATLIVAISARRAPDCAFLDVDSVLHLWPHCQHHGFVPNAKAQEIGRHSVTVCDGMHDIELTSLKTARKNTEFLPMMSTHLHLYFQIRRRLKERDARISENLMAAQLQEKRLKEEISSLIAANDAIRKKTEELDRRLNAYLKHASTILKRRVEMIREPLHFAELLAEMPGWSEGRLKEINLLLAEAATHIKCLNGSTGVEFVLTESKKLEQVEVI